MTTVLGAMAETERMAKVKGELYYLYRYDGATWLVSDKYRDDWLFRAYPGGRKELSKRGVAVVQETHCLCGREWSEIGHCYYCNKFKPAQSQ